MSWGEATQPIGLAGGVNVFEYAAGDPVNFIDPEGQAAWQVILLENPAAAAAAMMAVAALMMQAVFLTDRAGGRGDPFSGRAFGGGLASDFAAMCASASEIQQLVTAMPGIPAGGTSDSGRAYARGEDKQINRWAQQLGIPRKTLGNRIHDIKKRELAPNENIDIRPDGTVIKLKTGEVIGNVYDEN